MSRKKTIEELKVDAEKAEQKAKEAREKVQRATKAEEAKAAVDLLKAVREWRDALPDEKRLSVSDDTKLAEYFRRHTGTNRNRQ